MTDLTEVRLAEFLTARLCHELVNPIGAVSNGVELLEDEPDFAEDAARLVAQSALVASRRLQFYRVAYGATQPVSAERARKATLDLFLDGKVECDWPADLPTLPDGALKLACCLLLVAAEALPRGGKVSISVLPGTVLVVIARGTGVKVDSPLPAVIGGHPANDELNAGTIHAAFTGLLAKKLSARIGLKQNGSDELILAVIPS